MSDKQKEGVRMRQRRLTIKGLSSVGDIAEVTNAFNRHIHCSLVKDRNLANARDYSMALGHTVKDRLIGPWIRTQQSYFEKDPKRICYLSMEYYMGRFLTNTIINLGMKTLVEEALYSLGLELEELAEIEDDAGLGNGGLGRLAACYLDSMATLRIPSKGYGLRYEFGTFIQKIKNCEQEEYLDDWLALGNPWGIVRPESMVPVYFYGRVVHDDDGYHWVDTFEVPALPFDYPIPGFENNVVNTLRLWAAKPYKSFLLRYFNEDYTTEILSKKNTENITRVLYPQDNFYRGKQLRIKQEYFLVSATLQDIIRRYKYPDYGETKEARTSFEDFPKKIVIQLNDTHLTLAIPEFMRILMDIEKIPWEDAWAITEKTFAFTNHTVLPEALERWSVGILSELLPRHIQIIFEINKRFLESVAKKFPGDDNKKRKLSLIEEGNESCVNMAYLAIVGSFAVNGVSEVHSEILKKDLFKQFYEIFPEKFHNITNGVTPRRWLLLCNPYLADVISEKIGSKWITDLSELENLKPYVDDSDFLSAIMEIKRKNKRKLADYIKTHNGIDVDVDSMFDVQVKRFHEYKRQLLNCLHIITLYNKLKQNPSSCAPRTVIIGGKAAPGYAMAKDVISLICCIADIINNDSDIEGRLKVVFLENYRVTLAELVIPATDLSEQISVAGSEASGTGNMKFMMNGALTIGTLDGANIEIMEEVGEENMFIFGMKVEQVEELKQIGYNAWDYYNKIESLRQAVDQINRGDFSAENPNRFSNVVNVLLNYDRYCVFADYETYIECQEKVSEKFLNNEEWSKMALLNIASAGKFSSDRSIEEYAKKIWNVEPTHEKLPDPQHFQPATFPGELTK